MNNRMCFRSGEKARRGTLRRVAVANGSGLYFFRGDPSGELIQRPFFPSLRSIAAADKSFATFTVEKFDGVAGSGITGSGSPPATATDQRPSGMWVLTKRIRRPSADHCTGV